MTTETIIRTPAPGAEFYKNLCFERDQGGAALCKAYRGRAARPYAYLRFRSMDRMEEWIREQKSAADSYETYRAERKIAKAANVEKMADSIQVGTILHASWGWEQTNNDFYQVVARPSRYKAVVREICKNMDPDNGVGPMSGRVKPAPNHFKGPEVSYRIVEGGIKTYKWGVWASPCDPSKDWYESWYA